MDGSQFSRNIVDMKPWNPGNPEGPDSIIIEIDSFTISYFHGHMYYGANTYSMLQVLDYWKDMWTMAVL